VTKSQCGFLAGIAGGLIAAMWQWHRASRETARHRQHAHERGEVIFRNTPRAAEA